MSEKIYCDKLPIYAELNNFFSYHPMIYAGISFDVNENNINQSNKSERLKNISL